MPRVTARGPYDDHRPSPQVPDRGDAPLTVIEAVILLVEGQACEDLVCIGKIEPRSWSVTARFTGSKVILMDLCSYTNCGFQ
ncbi:hypothetical protein MAE02_40570 [Microvirga aerophila]|uniref:Uncharacterized protein n=1 Tax=Microvirga aerophila TaxID=670291 RepID=A0A512BWN1_9HYPH|nr:hypothetical protein MAE02_40570 [Microvirga aerophila]